MKRCFGTAVAAALLAASAAHAGEPIHKEVPAAKDGVVTIENLSGSVVVTGWDEEKVKVEGTLGSGSDRLDVDAEDDEVSIEVVIPHNARHVEETDLVVRVPRGSRLEIETVSADVSVGGVRGNVDVTTVSGKAEIGDVEDLDVQTVSGRIEVTKAKGPVEASSVSGSVILEDCGQRLEVSTTSGDIDLSGDVPDRVECGTTSGSVTADFAPAKDGTYRFESFSGEVVLRMPGKLDAAVDVETHSGRIRSEWDGRSHEQRYGPGASLAVREGDSSADIAVSTFSGSVSLEKR